MDFCAGRGSKQTRHWSKRKGVEKGRQSSQEQEGWLVQELTRRPPGCGVSLSHGRRKQAPTCRTKWQHFASKLTGTRQVGGEHSVPVQRNCVCDTADLCFVLPVLCGPRLLACSFALAQHCPESRTGQSPSVPPAGREKS